MSWWRDQVVPRATDMVLDAAEFHAQRRRVCEGLAGEVVELGFGSGLNLQHLPGEVRRVAAVEPSEVAWRRALPRIARCTAEVVRAGLDGQRLTLPSEGVDAALSTFTLCTIPDLDAALREVHRVLRPGGSLHFLEHGRAPTSGIARWQDRLQPVWGPVAAGCHLNRRIDEHVAGSGLRLEQLETSYGMGPRVFGYLYLGRATKPS